MSTASPYPRLPLFPMFLRMEGRACLVVGAGIVAQEKIQGLLAAGARIRVVAPHATPLIARLARTGKLEWAGRNFRAADLTGAYLVVAATSSPNLHEQILHASRRAGVLCNVVDVPARCDFFYGAVVRRGALQIAISTGGHSPALAQRIRKELEKYFRPTCEQWVVKLGRARQRSRSTEPIAARRKQFAHELVDVGIETNLLRAPRKFRR